MRAFIDLSEGEDQPVEVKVLAVLFLDGKRLYAVTAMVDDAPWYGLVHEHSDALISVD